MHENCVIVIALGCRLRDAHVAFDLFLLSLNEADVLSFEIYLKVLIKPSDFKHPCSVPDFMPSLESKRRMMDNLSCIEFARSLVTF